MRVYTAVEAVEWLMNTLKYTREEAIYTCKELTISQHISHVADKKREFVEGQSLYHFSVYILSPLLLFFCNPNNKQQTNRTKSSNWFRSK